MQRCTRHQGFYRQKEVENLKTHRFSIGFCSENDLLSFSGKLHIETSTGGYPTKIGAHLQKFTLL
jgi:hypothetical protein